jgi:hypothetical protein
MKKRINSLLRKAARSRLSRSVSLSSSDSREPSLPSSLITTPVSSQDLYEQMDRLGLIPNEDTPVFVESQKELVEEAKATPIPEPSVVEVVPVLCETPIAPVPIDEPKAPEPEKKGRGRPPRAASQNQAKNK